MKITVYFSALLLVLVVIFAMYSERAVVYAELDSLKLLPEPEPLTEIYLNDSLGLPATIGSGQTVPFSFNIHNIEGKAEDYSYLVYMVSADGTMTGMASGSVALADNTSTTIAESYRFAKAVSPSAPMTVFIELPDFREDLHFVLPSRESSGQ